MIFEAGNTVKFRVTFRDWAPEGQTGDESDPDSVTGALYDANKKLLQTFSPTKVSNTISTYDQDLTLPMQEGVYYVEFKGLVSGQPSLIRQKIQVKFDVK
jgi:hypothetical protein